MKKTQDGLTLPWVSPTPQQKGKLLTAEFGPPWEATSPLPCRHLPLRPRSHDSGRDAQDAPGHPSRLSRKAHTNISDIWSKNTK